MLSVPARLPAISEDAVPTSQVPPTPAPSRKLMKRRQVILDFGKLLPANSGQVNAQDKDDAKDKDDVKDKDNSTPPPLSASQTQKDQSTQQQQQQQQQQPQKPKTQPAVLQRKKPFLAKPRAAFLAEARYAHALKLSPFTNSHSTGLPSPPDSAISLGEHSTLNSSSSSSSSSDESDGVRCGGNEGARIHQQHGFGSDVTLVCRVCRSRSNPLLETAVPSPLQTPSPPLSYCGSDTTCNDSAVSFSFFSSCASTSSSSLSAASVSTNVSLVESDATESDASPNTSLLHASPSSFRADGTLGILQSDDIEQQHNKHNLSGCGDGVAQCSTQGGKGCTSPGIGREVATSQVLPTMRVLEHTCSRCSLNSCTSPSSQACPPKTNHVRGGRTHCPPSTRAQALAGRRKRRVVLVGSASKSTVPSIAASSNGATRPAASQAMVSRLRHHYHYHYQQQQQQRQQQQQQQQRQLASWV